MNISYYITTDKIRLYLSINQSISIEFCFKLHLHPTYVHRKNCYHLEYARNWAQNKAMEKRMVLPTQAFLEDIGLSEEVGFEEGQVLDSQDSRPHTPR